MVPRAKGDSIMRQGSRALVCKFAPTVFAIALLAACSGGGSQIGGAGVPPIAASLAVHQTTAASQTTESFPGQRWATPAFSDAVLTGGNLVRRMRSPNPCSPRGYLSLSQSGTIKVFKRPLPGNPPGYIGTITSTGSSYGWGAAVDPSNSFLYAGTAADNIDAFDSCGNLIQAARYTGNNFGSPLGITTDSSGCVYANESRGPNWNPQIDRWCAPGVPGPGSGPETNMQLPFYLAIGAGHLFVSGWDHAANPQDHVDKCPIAGPYSSCTTCWVVSGGAGYPGGIAVDGAGNIIVSDPNFSTIYTFHLPCGSAPVHTYTVPNCRMYTAIALSPAQDRLFVTSTRPFESGLCGPQVTTRARTLKYAAGALSVTGVATQVSPPIVNDNAVAIALH